MAKTIIDMKGIVKKFYIGQPNELTILKGTGEEVTINAVLHEMTSNS